MCWGGLTRVSEAAESRPRSLRRIEERPVPQRLWIRVGDSGKSVRATTGSGTGLTRLRCLLHFVSLLHDLRLGSLVADRAVPGATSNTQQDGQHGRDQGHPQRSLGNLMQFSVLLIGAIAFESVIISVRSDHRGAHTSSRRPAQRRSLRTHSSSSRNLTLRRGGSFRSTRVHRNHQNRAIGYHCGLDRRHSPTARKVLWCGRADFNSCRASGEYVSDHYILGKDLSSILLGESSCKGIRGSSPENGEERPAS